MTWIDRFLGRTTDDVPRETFAPDPSPLEQHFRDKAGQALVTGILHRKAMEAHAAASATPSRFTKRPVTVSAMYWDGSAASAAPIINWILAGDASAVYWCDGAGAHDRDEHVIRIRTLEGNMDAAPGDWIIRGVAGEFYPCKPDIFEKTYEAAATGLTTSAPADARYPKAPEFSVSYVGGEAVVNHGTDVTDTHRYASPEWSSKSVDDLGRFIFGTTYDVEAFLLADHVQPTGIWDPPRYADIGVKCGDGKWHEVRPGDFIIKDVYNRIWVHHA